MFEKVLDEDKAIIKSLKTKVKEIDGLDKIYSSMSDEQLKKMTNKFKQEIAKGKSLDDLLVDAYAVVREAARRVKGQYPYKVQLLGGIVMHNGDIAEMKTGEGKTLTAVLPVYLNALEGKGVHVVTVNEYLAQRDAQLNGEIYRFLGLSVVLNKKGLFPFQKKQAYACDITYTTSFELGFDYLRDNMVKRKEDRVLRGLHFALIDEVDSFLIDEAKTPLIISGGKKDVTDLYEKANGFIQTLIDSDYEIDIENQTINLSENGIAKAEAYFKVSNLYDIKYVNLVHSINQALKANFLLEKDVDYIVDNENDEIVIVDAFTGRLMHGRQFSEGLHQAIEAKESITIKEETKTIATIIYQNFFRLYDKLAGMTGTAKTDEDELLATYNMRVIQIPTNRPIIRKDYDDLLFVSKMAKFKALLTEVLKLHAKGQPVLIGTADIETSEYLSDCLSKLKIDHNVLNAKNHAKEAEIIKDAGQKYAVTIATNMAGRGTDIKLGEGVKELGGLAVLGSEKYESRRIDNQLIGRSGRQGDPGYSRFYVSMEDDIMLRYSTEKAKSLNDDLDDGPLPTNIASKIIKAVQEKAEGINYDIRKNVLEYDEILRKQRSIIYEQRNYILDNDNIHKFIKRMFDLTIENIIKNHVDNKEIDYDSIVKELKYLHYFVDFIPRKNQEDLIVYLQNELWNIYELKVEIFKDNINEIERQAALAIIDYAWSSHIDIMDRLKKGIGLRSYAQISPLDEYIKDGYELFVEMNNNIEKEITRFCLRLKVVEEL